MKFIAKKRYGILDIFGITLMVNLFIYEEFLAAIVTMIVFAAISACVDMYYEKMVQDENRK